MSSFTHEQAAELHEIMADALAERYAKELAARNANRRRAAEVEERELARDRLEREFALTRQREAELVALSAPRPLWRRLAEMFRLRRGPYA